jgi:hypothetical protein
MAGKFIKGALVEFMETFLLPLPNVIIFQFNPEKMTHTWTQAEAAGSTGKPGEESNPLAVKGMPGESFTFTIAVDARDMIADGSGVTESIAQASGVYSRLAALEMLLYPTGGGGGLGGLLGSVSASVSVGIGGGGGGFSLGGSASAAIKSDVPSSQVPTVLFVWGPGRILPVRVTGLTITEELYDDMLNPIHAEANLTLRVLTPNELEHVNGPLKDIAKIAYTYSQGLRQVLAVANLANAAESIIGMLPV